MKSKKLFLSFTAIIMMLAMALGSFSQAVQAAESDPNKPGEITGTVFRTVHDQTNENTADENRAYGGEVFGLGWYERPFDQQMVYLPFIDISKVLLGREDSNWVYVKIFVVGPLVDGETGMVMYGLELDTDLDNRGDYLLLVPLPKSTEWTTAGTKMLGNSDNSIGGSNPVLVDPTKPAGKGYDTEMKDDPNLIWVRISPDDPNVIEIAFKKSFIGGEHGDFIWTVWTFAGEQDFTKFDLNDFFTREEAGSPMGEDANYPVKGFWGLDNTPRYPSGFIPLGQMPGMGSDYEPFYHQRQHVAPQQIIPQN